MTATLIIIWKRLILKAFEKAVVDLIVYAQHYILLGNIT